MNRQWIVIAVALAGGAILGVGGSTVFGANGAQRSAAPEEQQSALMAQLRVVEADRDAIHEAALETQERLAGLSRELQEARAALDEVRASQALAEAESVFEADAYWDELDEAFAEVDPPAVETASETPEARGAPGDRGERGERWDPERIAEMRAERNERVRDFFDEAFERAPTRESQERIAAIEAYTQDAMELMRDWRGASESEREVLREQMGSMREAMRDLMREEHDARVRDAAARAGVTDAQSQQALADAIREVQQDPIFRGGGWTGRGGGGGGAPPTWGGRGRGGPPGR